MYGSGEDGYILNNGDNGSGHQAGYFDRGHAYFLLRNEILGNFGTELLFLTPDGSR